MRTPEEFDEIRPYDAEELPQVFSELVDDPEFQKIIQQVLPDRPLELICQMLSQCHTSLELQKTFFYPLLKQLTETKGKGLTLDSTSIPDKAVPHTFITNHRDIVLDSAFLSISLLDNGFPNTVEIAIGDNLLIKPWIRKLVRANKSFIVQRSVNIKQMLESSKRLSRYMHYAITQKKENIWIAQREGRAKDSNDRTQESVLKMIAMGGEGSLIERLKEMHLTPTALSYEYDPCDYLKAHEFQQKRDFAGFQKSPQDDLLNMQTGIFGYKGHIFFKTGNCLNDWLDTLDPNMPKGELFKTVAQKIDQEIFLAYRLYPNNYIAADLLRGNQDHRDCYTDEEVTAFENYIGTQLSKVTLKRPDPEFLRERILTMYANPVFNQEQALQETRNA